MFDGPFWVHHFLGHQFYGISFGDQFLDATFWNSNFWVPELEKMGAHRILNHK